VGMECGKVAAGGNGAANSAVAGTGGACAVMKQPGAVAAWWVGMGKGGWVAKP